MTARCASPRAEQSYRSGLAFIRCSLFGREPGRRPTRDARPRQRGSGQRTAPMPCGRRRPPRRHRQTPGSPDGCSSDTETPSPSGRARGSRPVHGPDTGRAAGNGASSRVAAPSGDPPFPAACSPPRERPGCRPPERAVSRMCPDRVKAGVTVGAIRRGPRACAAAPRSPPGGPPCRRSPSLPGRRRSPAASSCRRAKRRPAPGGRRERAPPRPR